MVKKNRTPKPEALPAAVVPPEELARMSTVGRDLSEETIEEMVASGDYDPANLREFDPAISLLHLERDGVIVEGTIDPFSGNGVRALLQRFEDELVKARAREDGAAPPAPVTVGDHPDPNVFRKARARELGHDIDPETGRCRNCRAAEWHCLDGNPCVPRADAGQSDPAQEAVA